MQVYSVRWPAHGRREAVGLRAMGRSRTIFWGMLVTQIQLSFFDFCKYMMQYNHPSIHPFIRELCRAGIVLRVCFEYQPNDRLQRNRLS